MKEDLDQFLAGVKDRLGHEKVTLSIRELLAHWEAKRRGYWVVDQIERDLREVGLVTDPPFTEGWIDNIITLIPLASGTTKPVRSGAAVDLGEDTVPIERLSMLSNGQSVALRVGSLPSANGKVVGVAPDDSLERAQSLMMRHDYSQLAVVSGQRDLRGAISWESIAQARIGDPNADLHEAIVSAETVRGNDDLLAQIPRVIAAGFVFVLGEDRKINGIVTTADLSQQFADLAKPFFVLAEIERRLRRVINSRFSIDELAAVTDPEDSGRQVDSADALTLGEFQRLIEEPSRWSKLSWRLDRKVFVGALDEIRIIRNEVMHFSPDPLDQEQLGKLDNFIKWLRRLDPDP